MKSIILSIAVVILICLQNQSQSRKPSTNGLSPKSSVSMFEQERREMRVAGVYMKAFLIAYESFKDETAIPVEQRHLENYDVFFRQEDKYYYVLFFARTKSNLNESTFKGGGTELGRDVEYSIDKEGYKIVKKTFFK